MFKPHLGAQQFGSRARPCRSSGRNHKVRNTLSITQTAAKVSTAVPDSTRLTFLANEVTDIEALLSELTIRYTSPEDPSFLEEADVIAHDLPVRIRREIRAFRLREPQSAVRVLSGWPIRPEKVGPTPSDWRRKSPANHTLEEELLLVLLGSLLGDVIAWSTQQDGRVVHDVLPIKGHEEEQLGTGSQQLLWWHVEDAFHPYRGDYLGLMCLRNPDRVSTTFAAISQVRLTADQVRLLFGNHYTIRPDESHLPKNRGDVAADELMERAYVKIDKMRTAPEKIAVLFGDLNEPYLRLDPYFMRPADDPDAQRALDALTAQIDNVLQDLVLEPGDVYFIDNYQAVHGRKSFHARFDGTDRWLKRINVTRDLRKSRDARRSAPSRVMY